MAGRISYYGGIVTNGLVLDLDAAKKDSYPGVGTSWNDISGNGYVGTLTNGPIFNSDNGGNIIFDGTNDYVSVANLPIIGNNSITISTWTNVISNKNTDNVLIIYGLPGTSLRTTGIYYRTTDTYVRFTSWGGAGVDYATGFLKDFNVWHNWVIVYNATSVLIYRDGVADVNGSQTRTINFQSGQFVVGGTVNYGVYNNQYTSNTIIYNRALSATEILQNYNALKNRYL